MRKITVAAVQMDITPKDLAGNLERALFWIEQAAQKKAQIICLPELFTTGFDYEFIANNDEAGKVKQAIAKKARDLGVFIVAGTIAEKTATGLYNTAYFFNDKGNVAGRYIKTHLFPLMQEEQYFKPGNAIEIFSTRLVRVGIMVCYDLRFPELARKLALNRAEIIFVPAEFPHPRIDHWKTLLRTRAIENQVFIVGVNRVGRDQANEFFGSSCVINPWGEIVAGLEDTEDIIVTEIDLSQIYEVRRQIPCLENRRGDLY